MWKLILFALCWLAGPPIIYYGLRNSAIIRWLENSQLGGLICRFWLGTASFIIAAIPCWIYLLAKLAFQPEGFWQNFFLFGVGVYFLGSIQLVLFIFYLVFLFNVVLVK